MRLATAIIGRGRVNEVEPTRDQIREKQIENARRNDRYWTESEATDFVRRGQSYFVHVDSDTVWTLYRGVVFVNGAAAISYNGTIEMRWFVDDDGDIVFLERNTGIRTWSDHIRRIEMRKGRAGG